MACRAMRSLLYVWLVHMVVVDIVSPVAVDSLCCGQQQRKRCGQRCSSGAIAIAIASANGRGSSVVSAVDDLQSKFSRPWVMGACSRSTVFDLWQPWMIDSAIGLSTNVQIQSLSTDATPATNLPLAIASLRSLVARHTPHASCVAISDVLDSTSWLSDVVAARLR